MHTPKDVVIFPYNVMLVEVSSSKMPVGSNNDVVVIDGLTAMLWVDDVTLHAQSQGLICYNEFCWERP